jgi:hypothetical protein
MDTTLGEQREDGPTFVGLVRKAQKEGRAKREAEEQARTAQIEERAEKIVPHPPALSGGDADAIRAVLAALESEVVRQIREIPDSEEPVIRLFARDPKTSPYKKEGQNVYPKLDCILSTVPWWSKVYAWGERLQVTWTYEFADRIHQFATLVACEIQDAWHSAHPMFKMRIGRDTLEMTFNIPEANSRTLRDDNNRLYVIEDGDPADEEENLAKRPRI